MFLNLFHGPTVSKKLQKLSESLKTDFGVDLATYEELSSTELAAFAHDLEYKKSKIISESDFNSYYNDPEYTRTTLLLEAIRIILREIHPKRKMKKKFQEGQEVDETLDYKIHPSTSVVVDHDIDNDYERPDLYWRRHQWEEERTHENHPITVYDADEVEYGENPDNTTKTIPSYAANAQPVGGTHENEQQAGIYVAVMDPNRFLGDKETKIMSIEPVIKSQNEISPLTRKVSDIMVDAEQPVQGTTFEIAGNRDAALQGKAPKKIVAVYEDDEDTNEEGKQEMIEKNDLDGLVEGLGTLLEGELERAELVLAIRDLVGRLQKIIEDLGKMGTDDIMPMVDGLRQSFSPEVAERFSTKAEQHIQTAADSIQAFKDTLDGEAQRMESRISDEDADQPMNDMAMGDEMGMDTDMNMVEPELGGDELGMGASAGEEDLGDLLGGDEAMADEEPLGRAKKESHVVTIAGKKVRLSETQLQALIQAMKITSKVNALVEAENNKPTVVDIVFGGVKFRLNEYQIKALLFAKNFNKIVESKKARVAKLSESQARMLKTAKALTEKIRELIEKKKPDADGDGVPDWADKKPGKDDNEGKKKKKKGKPKKGVVPPQFKKSKKSKKKKTKEGKVSNATRLKERAKAVVK